MNPKHFEKLQAHLEKVGLPEITCVVCGHGTWEAHDLVAPLKWKAREQELGEEAFPLLLASCQRCGNTLTFLWKKVVGRE